MPAGAAADTDGRAGGVWRGKRHALAAGRDNQIKGRKVSAIPGLHAQGKRTEYAAIGPTIGYNFGDFSVSGHFLFALFDENDAQMSIFHLGVTVPLK